MTPKQQRIAYGFSIWKAEEDAAELPPAFVETVRAMQEETPGDGTITPAYYMEPPPEYILTGVLLTDRAAAEVLSEEGLFPWVGGPPMVAVDGRLVQFMLNSWAAKIEASLETIANTMDVTWGLRDSIAKAHDTLLDDYRAALQMLKAAVDTAEAFGVPPWTTIKAAVPGEMGAFMPTYIMMPSTVLESWSTLYNDSATMLLDVSASLDLLEPVGLVAEYSQRNEEDAKAERSATGPMLVGFAALAFTAVGMVLAVTGGSVRDERPGQ